jgi:FAD/FMN-containing dehydrogenase
MQTRPLWNGAVGHDAALLSLCEIPGDVRAAVCTARNFGLPLSICGGGRDWTSRSVGPKGLVIDLSHMPQVEVDARARIATVAGGAIAGDVAAAAAPHGLAPVTGSIGEVGMAGLTLSGGYGPLNPRYGLALDNLVDVELVLADGRSVTASPREHADLFWALRGGGGDFGVVTSMSIRLHPLRQLLAGLILFPRSEAEAVLRGYGEAVRSAPDKLG